MTISGFDPRAIAAAHIDYQVQVKSLGDFPAELSPILLTGAFPLSPSPASKNVEGLKVFTYQKRYLCYCWFFQGGRQDERGRQTSSARVLIFPIDLPIARRTALANARTWLKQHDVETMTPDRFYRSLSPLIEADLSEELQEKARNTRWFPRLLAETIESKRVTLVAERQEEALEWLEILWYYAPDFLRLQVAWCTYVWSSRVEHEEISIASGRVEVQPPPSLWKRLFTEREREPAELQFDVVRGISSRGTGTGEFDRLEWLCREWISRQPWQGWTEEQKIHFLGKALSRLSSDRRTKLDDLVSGYPAGPKIQEFLAR